MRKLLAVIMLAMAPVLSAQSTKILNPKIDSLFPDAPTNYLTDVANTVKNPGDVNSRLKAIQDSSHISMVAVTLPTIKDYQPYEVAMEIGRKWKVATRNDSITAVTHNAGAVILIVMDKHKCFIATATGTEGYITDATAGRLCADEKNNFRAGEFGTGIINIANGIADRGRVEAATVATVRRPTPDTPTDWSFLWWIAGGVVLVAGLVTWVSAKNREAEEELDRQRAIRYAAQQAERARQEAIRLEQQREYEAQEKARWDALTPAQQKEELRIREARRVEQARLDAIAAQEAAIRRKKQEEEDAERRRNSSSSYSSYDYGSSSSSGGSSDFGGGFSSGGSDSFSGGGGGSDW